MLTGQHEPRKGITLVIRAPTAFEVSTADNPQMAKALQQQTLAITQALQTLPAAQPFLDLIKHELKTFLEAKDTRRFEALSQSILAKLPASCTADTKEAIDQCILAPMLALRQAALKEHAGLVKAYEQAGIDVVRLPDHTGSDAVFATDTGEQIGQTFVLGKLKNPRRHGEEACTLALLERMNIPVHRFPDMIIEGGDMIFSPFYNTLFVGEGFRNSGHPSLRIQAAFPRIRVIGMALQQPQFYHLDCCFTVLSGGHMLFYPKGLSSADCERLKQLTLSYGKPAPLLLSETEAKNFASNLVCVNQDIFVAEGALSEPHTRQLKDWGYRVTTVAYDTFHLSGGSVRCSTLTLRTPAKDANIGSIPTP